MYKKILVALDIADEDVAKAVAEQASGLAKMSGAEVHSITVVPDYGTAMVGTYFSRDHAKDAMHDAGKEVEAFIDTNFDSDISVRPHIVEGSVYKEIMRVAETLEVDLIVIGAHRPEFGDFLLGPNAARVVRHSRASVLVVRI